MNKLSRVKKSRNAWKNKAVERSETIRDQRKTIKRMNEAVEVAKTIIKKEEKISKVVNNNQYPVIGKAQYSDNIVSLQDASLIRNLCVLLIIEAIIPFRAVPRTLALLNRLELIPFTWIPHFTSVINWTLRTGIALLKSVAKVTFPWIAIVDCSIDIGTRKALVILRVPLDVLQQKGSAIGLKDCECIGIKIEEKWNGSSVEDTLDTVFSKSGNPIAILKDKGTDLKKGVELWKKKQTEFIGVIDDVGHEAANALKAEYAGLKPFKQFIKVIDRGAKRIRQTNLASLLPPKIRTKGRFQGITRVAKWADTMLEFISRKGRTNKGNDVNRIRQAFSGLSQLSAFLAKFTFSCTVVSDFLKLFKNRGINQKTYREGKQLLQSLPESSKLKKRLLIWLEKILNLQCRLSIKQTPLPVSSDVVESLFGKFKTIIQRNPAGELNRLVYVIPILCGIHNLDSIDSSLKNTTHRDLQAELNKEIPDTLRMTRSKLLSKITKKEVPKSGNDYRSKSG